MKKVAAALTGTILTIASAFGIYQATTPGVDSYGGLTRQEAVAAKNEGVDMYVQALSGFPVGGLVYPNDRVSSLENAIAANLKPAGYALVDCDGNGAADMDFARAGIPDQLWDSLWFVAVDAEVSCNRISDVQSACDRLAELGKPVCVVYTSYGAWAGYLGNPPGPAGSLLWNAYWDDNPDFDFEHLPYGGWTRLVGEQYQGGYSLDGTLTLVGGQNVDKDVFNLELLSQGCDLGWGGCWFPNIKRWYNLETRYSFDPAGRNGEGMWYNPDGVAQWGGDDPSYGGHFNNWEQAWYSADYTHRYTDATGWVCAVTACATPVPTVVPTMVAPTATPGIQVKEVDEDGDGNSDKIIIIIPVSALAALGGFYALSRRAKPAEEKEEDNEESDKAA